MPHNDPSIRRVDAEHTHRAFELRIIRLYTVLRSVAQGAYLQNLNITNLS